MRVCLLLCLDLAKQANDLLTVSKVDDLMLQVINLARPASCLFDLAAGHSKLHHSDQLIIMVNNNCLDSLSLVNVDVLAIAVLLA